MSELMTFDFPPYRLSGVVYGTLMNDPQSLSDLGDKVNEAPYKAPPKAPILYVKPHNTLASSGSVLRLPAGNQFLEVGAALGLVIGCTACRVPVDQAMDYIAGYTIVNDVSLPHDSFYRPSVRLKARDGFCPIGPCVIPSAKVLTPDELEVCVYIDDNLAQQSSTAGRVRPVAQLLADVTDFMTLQAGDILMLGAAADAPKVADGQHVKIEISGLGSLENTVANEEGLS